MSAAMIRFGFGADGVFKVLVCSAVVVVPLLLDSRIPVNPWLLGAALVVVIVSAVAEVAFAVRNGDAGHTKYLIAYDAGWIAVSAVAFLVLGADTPGAWTLWFGYQVVAAPVVAVLFGRGARRITSAP